LDKHSRAELEGNQVT